MKRDGAEELRLDYSLGARDRMDSKLASGRKLSFWEPMMMGRL